jgi:hypothetical protein
VSRRPLIRRDRLSWPALRQREAPAGANRPIWLVGKQSRSSHLSSSTRRSIAGKWFAALGPLHHARTPFRRSSFSPLIDLSQAKSSLRKSPNRVAVVQVRSRFLNRLSMRELAPSTTLTCAWRRVYVCLRRSRFRGTVARYADQFSPPGCLLLTERTRVLTPFREGRSRDLCWLQSGRFPDRRVIGIVVLHDVKESPIPPCVVQDFPNNFESTDLRFSIAGRAGCGFFLGI